MKWLLNIYKVVQYNLESSHPNFCLSFLLEYNKEERQKLQIHRYVIGNKNSKILMGNKKIFTISSDFELIKKPKWLDGFRVKHDKPFPYHVTLKTCTYFDIDNFENLKKDLSGIVKKYSEIKVIFNKLFISRSSKGECIMIKADNNKKLNELQKEIVKKFSKYGNYITKEYEKIEKSFIPHITIARHLSSEQLITAKKDLGKKLFCEAVVKELSLMIVENNTDEEWLNHNNKSYYKLQNK